MEKYYWNPTREDRIGVCMGIFQVSSIALQACGAPATHDGVLATSYWKLIRSGSWLLAINTIIMLEHCTYTACKWLVHQP
jgi:hypothetical protein